MRRFSVCAIAIGLCLFTAANVAAQGMLPEHAGRDREDLDATPGFGVVADMGTIVPNLRLEPSLGFWMTSQETVGSKLTVRDLTMGAHAKYLFKIQNSKVRPFAGGGLGLHILHAGFEATGFPDTGDTKVKLGVDMGGGFYVPMSPTWDFTTELWYGIVSDMNQLWLGIGAQYNFGI